MVVVRPWIASVALLAACGGTGDPCVDHVAGTICAVAGTGTLGYNGDGQDAIDTDLYAPTQIRRGPDGRIWLMDWNNFRLRAIEDDGSVVTIAGSGAHGFAAIGAPAVDSPLENPVDFAFDADGAPVFVSTHDPRVLRIEADGTIGLIAGTGYVGDLGDDGPAVDAWFDGLAGVAIGPAGEVYVADGQANRVRVVKDGLVHAFAGTGTAGYAGDGGAATAAELRYPSGLAVAPDGSVYVADRMNHAIRRIAPDGTIATVAGRGVPADDGDGGPAVDAGLAQPDGVAVDDAGRVYVADRDNFRVRRIDVDGTIATVAGQGTYGFRGDGGDALEALLGEVARLSWSPGELFIADQGNSCARALLLD
jgi:sugar lactone lactonase YvrE